MRDARDKKSGQFLPGNGGRPQGSRNKLQAKFMDALAADFETEGDAVIRFVRADKPVDYLKIIASVLPKELLMPDSPLSEVSDDDLAEAIAIYRAMKEKKAA
jgi:hypothetical protein